MIIHLLTDMHRNEMACGRFQGHVEHTYDRDKVTCVHCKAHMVPIHYVAPGERYTTCGRLALGLRVARDQEDATCEKCMTSASQSGNSHPPDHRPLKSLQMMADLYRALLEKKPIIVTRLETVYSGYIKSVRSCDARPDWILCMTDFAPDHPLHMILIKPESDNIVVDHGYTPTDKSSSSHSDRG